MLVRIDLHQAIDVPSGSDGTTRLGTYRLDTSNHYGSHLRWAALEYGRATVSLVPDPGDLGRAILYTAPPRTGARLWLEPWVLSPLAGAPLRIGRRLLHAFLVRRTGSDSDFEAFERASNGRVAEWEATFGWHYLGVFRAFGLETPMRADLYIIDAKDPAEAMSKTNVEEPSDVERIHANGVRFLDRGERRYQLWMSPLTLTAATRRGVTLADHAPAG